MADFTHLNDHDNSNAIDGTPGCPHVQVMGSTYMCSASISAYVAKIARGVHTALVAATGCTERDPYRFNADHKSQPLLVSRFHKAFPDADYELIEFARGLKTNTWYARTVSF